MLDENGFPLPEPPKPPSYTTLRGRYLREALIAHLGGRCAICGTDDVAVLEIDHINGRDYDVCKLSSHCRAARYWREALLGELRVLCSKCNRKEQGRPTKRKRKDPF